MSSRPDPYAQITNPLNTGWGAPAPTPSAAAPQIHMSAPVKVRRRSPWVRRVVTVVVLALLAGGVWWQRERIGDLVDRATGDLTEEGAAPSPDTTAPDTDLTELDLAGSS